MTHYFSKRWIVVLQLTTGLLVLWSCQLPQKIAQPVTTQATTEATLPSDVSATAEAIQANVEFGPGSFRLEGPAVGLAALSSYKATLTLSFNGTQADQPSQWSRTYVMLARQDLAARQLTIESAGGDSIPIFMAEVNGVSYERRGENDCTASTAETGNTLAARWEPAGFLSAIIGADPAGDETINGMATSQYIFDERALGQAGFTKSTGQVWVASENGYVIEYFLTTTAGADYFGEGIEGALTWEYHLTEINQPVPIELPEECPGGLVDAPLMPDAQGIRQLPGVTIYSTAGSIPDVLAFYQEQLPALGWVATTEHMPADGMGLADFIQEDQQLSVIVTSLENTVTVRLVIGAAPEPPAIP